MKKSIEVWGIPAQIAMLAEECSELSVAALHMNRKSRSSNPETFVNFAEEIADVEYMIAEMKMIYPELQAKLDYFHNIKSKRTEEKLNRGSQI
jgi:hypothetical protein